MATLKDVRNIALSLDGVFESAGDFRVEAKPKPKLVAWPWKERVDPKKPRVPNPNVLAVRVAGLDEKDALLSLRKDVLFTEPHYDGYPAVLIQLPKISVKDLRALITASWTVQTEGARGRARTARAPLARPSRPSRRR